LQQPELVAGAPDHDFQLPYFTTMSLLADDATLIAIGEAGDGNPNLYSVDLLTGARRQLTANLDGTLRSYVYFLGSPFRGFGKASISVDQQRGLTYFIQGRELRVVDLEGSERRLATLPDNEVTAYTHVSPDGSRICVPTIDAAALEVPRLDMGPDLFPEIDEIVQAQGLSSLLRIYDTASGELVACEPVPRGWVTHVQFSPTEPDLLLYNHEWPGDCGIRRIWLWDGTTHRRLRTEATGRSRNDWICHEMWERDGSGVIYHGAYADGTQFVGRVALDGSEPTEISLRQDFRRYGHFTVGPKSGSLVTDGYYTTGAREDQDEYCPWLSRLDVDWARGAIEWTSVGRSDSSWRTQDEHPHPIFDNAGRAIYFTSDRSGRRGIYRVTTSPSLGNPLSSVLTTR
jgi:oligogalacturonide lyase